MRPLPGILAGLMLLTSACAAPAGEDASAGSGVGNGVAETAAPETQDEIQGEVKPSMDPLDRVDDTCGIAAVKPYLGKAAADIPATALPERFRILKPGDQVTMDYVPARLNVLTNADGIVIGLKCG